MRHADTNPPDRPLTLAEWAGTKVWQVTTILPTQSGEPPEVNKGKHNPAGLIYLSGHVTREDDRSRTPLKRGKSKGDFKGES